MAQQSLAAAKMTQQDCTKGRFVSWDQTNPVYFPLMRAVQNTLEVELENRGESVGPAMSQIGEIEITVLYKRGVNCAVEKCVMRFKNKYCIHQGYEFLHEGNLIF